MHNYIIIANCWNHDRRSMSNASMSYGVHKLTPHSWYNVRKSLSFHDLAKRTRKVKGQNNSYCAQLHHPSYLLKPWLKVKVKQFNELWGPQSDPRSRYNVRKIISFRDLTKKSRKGQFTKQQVLCTTSSSQLTIETMIEGQSQTVQWALGSTKIVSDGRTVGITRSLPANAGGH